MATASHVDVNPARDPYTVNRGELQLGLQLESGALFPSARRPPCGALGRNDHSNRKLIRV